MPIKTFFLTSAVIFISIGYSSQFDGYTHSGLDPGPSSSAASEQFSTVWTSSEEPPFRVRSRSPASSRHSIEILGYPLEELGYIRLIPRTNQSLLFEFRNYNFPAGKPICWRVDGNKFFPVPAQEHIVLSTSNDNIVAILSFTGVLRGIHETKRSHPRVRMNMLSGTIHRLTPDDIKDCPVGTRHPIFPQNFLKAYSSRNSLHYIWNLNGDRDPGSSPPARQHPPHRSSTPKEAIIRARSDSPPGEPPSDQVLGCKLKELGYVRLIPCTNMNQRFEFRRYFFPRDKPIRMRIYEKKYAFSPTTEYIVVSTSNGDVCAILDHSGTLCGIYRTDKNNSRAKINIISGAIDNMTWHEKRDCPIGRNRPIFPDIFVKAHADFDSLRVSYNSNSENICGSPPTAMQGSSDRAKSPPGRPPSDEVLGYPLERLGHIRLIPHMNPHRRFEFRRYVFPPFKGILLMSGHGEFVPLPNREHIVLSTSTGHVFAILEYTGILRGIYQKIRENNWRHVRIKINMVSGECDAFNEFEMKECHVGKNYPIIPRWFDAVVSNEDSLQCVYY